MSAACCHHHHDHGAVNFNSAAWRRALWIALIVNGGMFIAEMIAGVAAGSSALQADALDFLGDSANYALSLGVAGLGLVWRARAALAKGISLGVLSLAVLAITLWNIYTGTVPAAAVMGTVGVVALLANLGVALMLYRFRTGDANMRSVWICSRNDAIGNIAVMLAALGVFGTGTGWPDFIVATIMATLGITGAWQIVRLSLRELSSRQPATPAPAE